MWEIFISSNQIKAFSYKNIQLDFHEDLQLNSHCHNPKKLKLKIVFKVVKLSPRCLAEENKIQFSKFPKKNKRKVVIDSWISQNKQGNKAPWIRDSRNNWGEDPKGLLMLELLDTEHKITIFKIFKEIKWK